MPRSARPRPSASAARPKAGSDPSRDAQNTAMARMPATLAPSLRQVNRGLNEAPCRRLDAPARGVRLGTASARRRGLAIPRARRAAGTIPPGAFEVREPVSKSPFGPQVTKARWQSVDFHGIESLSRRAAVTISSFETGTYRISEPRRREEWKPSRPPRGVVGSPAVRAEAWRRADETTPDQRGTTPCEFASRLEEWTRSWLDSRPGVRA